MGFPQHLNQKARIYWVPCKFPSRACARRCAPVHGETTRPWLRRSGRFRAAKPFSAPVRRSPWPLCVTPLADQPPPPPPPVPRASPLSSLRRRAAEVSLAVDEPRAGAARFPAPALRGDRYRHSVESRCAFYDHAACSYAEGHHRPHRRCLVPRHPPRSNAARLRLDLPRRCRLSGSPAPKTRISYYDK